MKQAFRIISRMKGYTLLSILGLIISLSGTVIISRYLYQEWTIDHWMPDLDRTYICCCYYPDDNDWWPRETYDPNHESHFVSPVLNQSDVECWTDIHVRSMYVVKPKEGEVFYPQALSVDSNFTKVYPLETIEGTLVLRAKEQCILSEGLAKRLFLGESAVSKTITVGEDETRTVVGIFRQPETKSSLRFDIVDYADEDFYAPMNSYGFGIVRLCEGADVEAFNQRQPDQKLHISGKNTIRWGLKPYTQKLQDFSERFYIDYDCLAPVASSSHLWMLLFVAILLLFVGLFNFVNLFAVMRSHRRHELEVRRIFGASRWNIFCQLYAETFLLAILTMIGVWTIVELTEPLLATYYNIEVMGQWRFDVTLTVGIVFGLPLISSLIPKKLLSLREGLGVGLQFFISLALLNVSIYFMRQLHVMMTADPGFRTKGLLTAVIFPPDNKGSWTNEEWEAMIANHKRQSEVVKQRLSECPYLKGITLENQFFKGLIPVNLKDGGSVNIMGMTSKAAQMYGLQLVEGVIPADSVSYRDYVCVANESAIKALGIKDINTDVVQFDDRLWWSSDVDRDYNPPYRIVGVVRDFNPDRQSEPVKPILITPENLTNGDNLFNAYQMNGHPYLLDIAEGHEEDIIRELKDIEKEINGTTDLRYQWVEDERKALYKEDQRTARIFVTFSMLAIAVTCLGVLGLMMFDVRRRYREIALRKVNGATFRDIALLLSRRYLIIYGIAAVASLPVSLLVIHRIMASYTIRTSFAWWIPLLSIAIILVLCALTLWQQVWKATRIKPYEVLKDN